MLKGIKSLSLAAVTLAACSDATQPAADIPFLDYHHNTANGITISDLGTLGGSWSEAYDINDLGQVVGRSATASDAANHAFLWTAEDGMVDIAGVGGTLQEAKAINNLGEVVGTAGDPGSSRAVLRQPGGGLIDLGTLGGTRAFPFDINDLSQVVGTSFTASDAAAHAFLWNAEDGMVDLGTLGGNRSDAHGINELGQVAGFSTTALNEEEEHAFLWTVDAGMVDLGTLGGSRSFAYGVNDLGQVVGWSNLASQEARAFLWTPEGGMVDLGVDTQAYGINDLGHVVGYDPGWGNAFLWTADGGTVVLPTLGGTSLPGTMAQSINNLGQVAGFSTTASGEMHAVLWTIELTPSCRADVTRFSQADPLWGNETYDHSTRTIHELGCALTSLAMAFNFAGIQNDPGSLNQFMTDTDHDYAGELVNWGPTVRDRSGGVLKFNAIRTTDGEELKNLLCSTGFPVIVGVNLAADATPRHFVLATGVEGGLIQIADPLFADRTTLDAYNNRFETRGYVADPPGDISELDLAVNNANLLVIDERGRRTGIDPVTGERVEEIPRSAYFLDALENDVTSEPPTQVASFVHIFQPPQGEHTVVVIGEQLGSYELSIRAFSQDGAIQPELTVPGVMNAGTASSFKIRLRTSPHEESSVQRAATFESTLSDIGNSLQLGLIDSKGIARALSRMIDAAADAASRGQFEASENVLEGFKSAVTAQQSRHIEVTAAQVLLEDADHLIVRMQQAGS